MSTLANKVTATTGKFVLISITLIFIAMVTTGCKTTGLATGTRLAPNVAQNPEPFGIERIIEEERVSYTFSLDRNEQTNEYTLRGKAIVGGRLSKTSKWNYPNKQHRVADAKIYFYSIKNNLLIETITIELDAKHTEELYFNKTFSLKEAPHGISFGLSFRGWNSFYPGMRSSNVHWLPSVVK